VEGAEQTKARWTHSGTHETRTTNPVEWRGHEGDRGLWMKETWGGTWRMGFTYLRETEWGGERVEGERRWGRPNQCTV
jgi:hypothetical protein